VRKDTVEAVIDDLVRPVVEADGGTIEVVEIADEMVVVHLSGACAGCPGAPYTRAGLIEPALAKALGTSVRVKLTTGK
jgi:Fe-S cluster biogenesis protein NfuA